MTIVPYGSRKAVSLLGAGTQGRRLAYMWLSQGNNVHLIDSQQSQLDDAVRAVRELALHDHENAKGTSGQLLTHSLEDLEVALADSWLVVDCVPERIDLKRKVIAQLDALAPTDTIVASNSSSYSVSEIIEGQTLKSPARILSAHSYWPPETPAIEIMPHSGTATICIDMMMERCCAHGFEPFRVQKDSMGYIYNRIWAAIKREALLAASEGVASPAEIDAIFKSVLKTPKGPFEQMDVVGLDVVLDIEEHYAARKDDIPPEPRVYLQRFVGKGMLGVKSGRGFYQYSANGND